MKSTILLVSVAAAMIALSSCSCNHGGRGVSKAENESADASAEMEKAEEPEYDIVTSHGTMRVRLYSGTPKHRDNFKKLVSEHYYDGIRFHRVISGFMIQTGDSYSRDTALIDKWGQGGPDYTVPAEFTDIYNHKKGALAAARKSDIANPKKASSGSQFYIVHDPGNCSHLDGQYTVFGEVIEGLEVIDRIASVPVDRYDRPLEDVVILGIKPVADGPEPEPEASDVEEADGVEEVAEVDGSVVAERVAGGDIIEEKTEN